MSDGLRMLPTKARQARHLGPDGRRFAPSFDRKMHAEYWRTAELRLIEPDTWPPPAARQAEIYHNLLTGLDTHEAS